MTALPITSTGALASYSELKTAIADWMNRSDLTGAVGPMIALAESRMRRKLEPVMSETVTTLTTSEGLASLPADFGTLNRAVYNYYTLPRWSGFSTPPIADNQYSSDPFAYTIEGGLLRVWPPIDVDVTVFYNPILQNLSVENDTNFVLLNHPDAYFYGAMMFAEGYVANDQRAGNFKALFDEAMAEVETYLYRQRYSGPLVPKIAREF